MQSRKWDEECTPGDSKQHRFVCTVVLWHEAGPVVEQPELRLALRLKRSVDERKEKGDAEVSGIDADNTARDKI